MAVHGRKYPIKFGGRGFSVCENYSCAPLGLVHFPLLPTAHAVGCILAPLRGYNS
jgi:hypothetical protein